MVKSWVSDSGKGGDKIDELEKEIEILENKRRELVGELESVSQNIFEKQNRLRELYDAQTKQDSLS
ncbi:MAG TPA: hypothetical protein VJN71_07190 [Nitrososphaerales archaeon]|nr:hypothetical protein [Nitrososphaerales archaeon]